MKHLAAKLSPYFLRFRQLATRNSFRLIYVWAGTMLLGLGLLYYKEKKGERVGCERSVCESPS